MKKVILFVSSMFVIASLVMVTDGCKRGEGDPTISLRSRKARVSGDWKIAKYMSDKTETITSPSGDIITTHILNEFDGSKSTETRTDTYPDTVTIKTTNSELIISYTFSKDGVWKSNSEAKTSRNDSIVFLNPLTGADDYYTQVTASVVGTSSTGTWDFMNGVSKDFKNKENMVIKTTSSTETTTATKSYVPLSTGALSRSSTTNVTKKTREYYTSNDIWTLTTLKHKKMIIEADIQTGSNETLDGVPNSDKREQKGNEKYEFMR